jgi:UDP-N-acetylglucosamine 2-epimerase
VDTVEAGWNRLVGLDPDAAAAALAELPEPEGEVSPASELYGAGLAGERVSKAIVGRLG